MKKISLTLFLLSCITVYAQDYDFGKVSEEEVKEKFYPLDSTADAAYLYKYRRTYYDYRNNKGLEVINEFIYRTKIYTKKGFKYATINIPYVNPEQGESEKITDIKAYTYNIDENGKIVENKLDKDDIFDEKISRYRHIKKITMPNLKEGSVVEIKYTLKSPYLTYIDDLEFQYGIPVKKFSATIENPDWYIFAQKNKGFYSIEPKESTFETSINIRNKVRTTTSYGGRGGNTTSASYENNKIDVKNKVLLYEAENIPALKDDEPFVSNINNYRGGVKYELVATRFPNEIPKNLSTSWDDVAKQIFKSENFGGELEKTNYFKDDIDPLIANSKSNDEVIAAIFEFVKRRVKWDGYLSKYTNKGVKSAYEERVGNSAEINLMLTSMLRHANLNAYPVLVSSKDNGIPLFPTLSGFNYVVCLVQFADNSYVLLDATEPYSLPNVLPVRALNWEGRLVTKEGNSTSVKLTSTNYATEENMILAKLTEDLTLEGIIRTKFENLNALNFRRNYNHVKEEELIEKFEENNKVEIENFKIDNKENLEKPVTRNVKFSSEDLIETINNKVYVEPLLFLTKRTNPFKLNERKFPVDFAAAWKDVNRVSIDIPEGYKVEFLPETLAIALPENVGVFKYQVQQAGKKIKVFSSLEFNASLIPAQYYPYLKDFYGKLVKKETEKIVLVKI